MKKVSIKSNIESMNGHFVGAELAHSFIGKDGSVSFTWSIEDDCNASRLYQINREIDLVKGAFAHGVKKIWSPWDIIDESTTSW